MNTAVRLASAAAGWIVGVPGLLFFWVGAQTFVQSRERAIATP